jgi:mono/diheme cytochrome c family protein
MRPERIVRPILAFVIVGLIAFSGPAGAQPDGGDAKAGERVFQANCAMCHGSDAAGMMGMHPSLRGAVERLSPEGVEVTIRKGRKTMPPMPGFEGRLSDRAIADVMAYLASLPEGPRNFGPERDGMGGMMRSPDTSDGDGRVPVWLGVTLVVLVLALATLVVLVVRQSRRTAVAGAHARSVLDRRYAAGELTRDEYLERRRDLEA